MENDHSLSKESNSALILKKRALAYLARREYSRAELFRKLAAYADNRDTLSALLDSLEREGWLCDSRFAESVVHRRASRFGTNRIIYELKQHTLDIALIERIGEELHASEWQRAKAVWAKKYRALPTTSLERAKQARFLANRGFSREIIARLLAGADED